MADKLDKVLTQYSQVLLGINGIGHLRSSLVEGLGEQIPFIEAEQGRAVDKLQKHREEEEEEFTPLDDCYQLEEMKQEIHHRMHLTRQFIME